MAKMENQPGRADPTLFTDDCLADLECCPPPICPILPTLIHQLKFQSTTDPHGQQQGCALLLFWASSPRTPPLLPTMGDMCWICPLRDYSHAVFTPGEICSSITKFKYLFSHLKTFNLLWQQLHQLFKIHFNENKC